MRAALLGASLLGLALACVVEKDAKQEPPKQRAKIEVHPAVGSLDGLAPEVARAFAEDPLHFAPLRPVGPGDWLDEHPEPGQTVAQFLAGPPNVPSRDRSTIYIQPIGEFPDSAPSLPVLAGYVEVFFGLEVEVLEPITVESLAVTTRESDLGRQLRTDDVLDALHRRLPADAFLLVGLTIEDLYPDEAWNYVFGMASLERRVSVYSLLRFDSKLERSLKIMTHELTHSFGILHCIHYDCLMNGTNGLAELDVHPLHPCPVCLRKLHAALGFDPVARHERLRAYYSAHGLHAAAQWTEDRIATITD